MTLVRYRGDEMPLLLAAVSASLDELRPWMPWANEPPSVDSVTTFVGTSLRQWEESSAFHYWLRETATDELVGSVGLMGRIGPGALEVGYWVRTDRTRRGYASAATDAISQAGLAMPGIERIEVHCDEANLASAGVPRRLGFRLDRIAVEEPAAPGESGRMMVWVRSKPAPGCS